MFMACYESYDLGATLARFVLLQRCKVGIVATERGNCRLRQIQMKGSLSARHVLPIPCGFSHHSATLARGCWSELREIDGNSKQRFGFKNVLQLLFSWFGNVGSNRAWDSGEAHANDTCLEHVGSHFLMSVFFSRGPTWVLVFHGRI
jgi:hypothetical protein